MRASQKSTGTPRTAREVKASAPGRSAARAPDVAKVAAAARGGRHAEAIELAGAALVSARVAASDRLDLLDLRAESHIALGDVESAGADAEAMLHIARRARKPAMLAQALNRRAFVEIRTGRSREAVATADEAAEAARRGRHGPQEALGLLRLAEAQFRLRDNERAARTATQSARLFKALGGTARRRAARCGQWPLHAAARAGRPTADRAAQKALALARAAATCTASAMRSTC